uniref:Uncharacterized protein n=1 Tax=Sphenodon punctatus TaxID=8508 RepID=A0A8D0G8Y4_SPHPU
MHMEALAMQDRPSLETMLQRMEEIEQYQEVVRRRFNQIVYADPEFWAEEEKRERESASIDKRPLSPHPIQITRLIGHREPAVDIVLERPLDGNAIDEEMEEEEKREFGNNVLRPLTQNLSQLKAGGTFLPMPRHLLQSIYEYNLRYARHLKLIAHETVGSFNPWRIAESLAEELTEEALGDVAAELQDVCEDYAEAVFTSEFLQPKQ